MVKYNATQATQEKSTFSPVQVAVGLAEARESLAQHMSDMAEIDSMIDHATIALSILDNFKGNEAQAIALVNHQHAMENLLGVAESKITVSAAKEGLGDALGAAWKKIKEFISWLVQKIKDFFVWIGKKIGLVKKTNDDLMKEIMSDPETKEAYERVVAQADAAKQVSDLVDELIKSSQKTDSLNKRLSERMRRSSERTKKRLKELDDEYHEMLRKIGGVEGLASTESYTAEKQTQLIRFYKKQDLLDIVNDLKVLLNPQYLHVSEESIKYLDEACDSVKSASTEEAIGAAFVKASENINKLCKTLSSEYTTTSGLNAKLKVLHIDSNFDELTKDTIKSFRTRLVVKKDIPACNGSLRSMGYPKAEDILAVFDAFDSYLVESSRTESKIRPVVAKLDSIEKKLASIQISPYGKKMLDVVSTYSAILRSTLVSLTDHTSKGVAIIDKCNGVFRSALGTARRIAAE